MTRGNTVSFVILNYNGMEFLPGCLESVKQAIAWEGKEHEIIVVDNGSDDSSVPFMEERFPFVRIIRLPENRFVTAYNEGFVASANAICIFLNNDMIVEKNFLTPLLGHFEKEEVFAVGPLVLPWGGVTPNRMTGKSSGSIWFGYFRARGVHYDTLKKQGLLDCPSPSLHIGAGAYDRKKYLELGGLDPLYSPCYWEDTDLCFRAWRRGWTVIFEPRSMIYHKHQGTTSQVFPRKQLRTIMGKNRHLFMWRNLLSLRFVIPYILFLPFRILLPLLKGDGTPLAAFFFALKQKAVVWPKRKEEKKIAKRSDLQIVRLSKSNRVDDCVFEEGGKQKERGHRFPPEINLENENNSHVQLIKLTGHHKRVLEIGPERGYVTKMLKEQGCSVTCIEIDSESSKESSLFCDRMILGDVEQINFEKVFGCEKFDVILLGDILEHLKNPWTLLCKVREQLAKEGSVVSSIPNVAHGSVRLSLLKGEFSYSHKGILDKTHLRFFTRKTIEELFVGAGFVIRKMIPLHMNPFEDTNANRHYEQSEFPRAVIKLMLNDPDASTYQFIIQAYPKAQVDRDSPLRKKEPT